MIRCCGRFYRSFSLSFRTVTPLNNTYMRLSPCLDLDMFCCVKLNDSGCNLTLIERKRIEFKLTEYILENNEIPLKSIFWLGTFERIIDISHIDQSISAFIFDNFFCKTAHIFNLATAECLLFWSISCLSLALYLGLLSCWKINPVMWWQLSCRLQGLLRRRSHH